MSASVHSTHHTYKTVALVGMSGAMQVSVGQEAPGYMPWSSGTEIWVGWCYPYPRPVQASMHSAHTKGGIQAAYCGSLSSHFHSRLNRTQ